MGLTSLWLTLTGCTVPQRVLQVVPAGKRDGAEEALDSRHRVQQQSLGEVLREGEEEEEDEEGKHKKLGLMSDAEAQNKHIDAGIVCWLLRDTCHVSDCDS